MGTIISLLREGCHLIQLENGRQALLNIVSDTQGRPIYGWRWADPLKEALEQGRVLTFVPPPTEKKFYTSGDVVEVIRRATQPNG